MAVLLLHAFYFGVLKDYVRLLFDKKESKQVLHYRPEHGFASANTS